MRRLLRYAHAVDRLNRLVGIAVAWLILLMVLLSTGNAVSRKVLQISSNGFLEIQWYLFAAIFLLAAAYTLQKNEHVRIDILSARLGPRAQAWLDILGGLLFLLPLCGLVLYFAWPFFLQSFLSQEYSASPGGLILWPAKMLIPLSFLLLGLQGSAEIIKRVAFLMGAEPAGPAALSPEAEMLDAAETKSP